MDIKEHNVEREHAKQQHPWEVARFAVVRDILGDLLNGQRRLNIVDVGCGDAFFLSTLASKYPHNSYYAVDTAFTPEMIAEFESQYKESGIRFYANINDLQLDGGQIDLILLLDVIEHIEHDVEFLTSLRALPSFDEKTQIIITVPSFQSLFCARDKFLGHYRRYSEKMLLQHIEKAGLKQIKSGYFFTSLLLPRMLQVVRDRLVTKEEKTGIGDYNGNDVFNSLTVGLLKFDYALTKLTGKLGLHLPGLSCYCLCR